MNMEGTGDVPAYYSEALRSEFPVLAPERLGPFYCCVCEALAPYIFFPPGAKGYRQPAKAYCAGHAALVAWMVTQRIDRAGVLAE